MASHPSPLNRATVHTGTAEEIHEEKNREVKDFLLSGTAEIKEDIFLSELAGSDA